MLRVFQGVMLRPPAVAVLCASVALIGATAGASGQTSECLLPAACDEIQAFEKAVPSPGARTKAKRDKDKAADTATEKLPSGVPTGERSKRHSSRASAGTRQTPSTAEPSDLKTLSMNAATAYLKLESACEKGGCDPLPYRARLVRTLAKYVAFLMQQLDKEGDKTKASQMEDELWRVLSGSAGNLAVVELIRHCQEIPDCNLAKITELIRRVAELAARNNQPPDGLLDGISAYLRAGGDPSQFGPALSQIADTMQEGQVSKAQLGEVLELYKSMHDPVRRKRVVALLRELENSLSADERRMLDKLSQASSSESDADLMTLLLKARRSLVAQTLGATAELGYRPGNAETAKWLILDFVSPTGDHAFDVTTDFQEAIAGLLTAASSDGVHRHIQSDPPSGDRMAWACGRQNARNARALLSIRIATAGTQINATGEVYMKDEQVCQGQQAPQRNSTIEVTMSSTCPQASVTAETGRAGQPCIDDQLRAAQHMVGMLSGRYSMFANLKYLQAGRPVEQMGPTLHPGVRITDLGDSAAVDAPVLLASAPGLRLSGDCGKPFADGLSRRLRFSYARDVGPLVEVGDVPELRLESPGSSDCRVRLLVGRQQVYGLLASAATDRMDDAGDDVARVLGQYYRDVRHSVSEPPSRWSALLFSGLPYLRDQRPENDRIGWTLSATDIVLTACGISAGILAVRERNLFADNSTGSLDSANALLWTGASCLAAVALERGLAAVFYK